MFDLEGQASMKSSPNCAMELALLYQLFGEKLTDDKEHEAMRKNIQLVVLTEADIGDADPAALAKTLQQKLANQGEQATLFKAAYEKCATVLNEARATKYLGQWIEDFANVVGTETSRRYSTRGMEVSKVRYLQQAFHRLLDDAQLSEYLDLRGPRLQELSLAYNSKITGEVIYSRCSIIKFRCC